MVEVREDRNSLGKAAFVVGLIALLMSFVPIIGFVAWLLAPLAVVFGLIALRRPSRSLAIAGILCGLIALYVCFTWIEATEKLGNVLESDTFNTSGETQDLSDAPIIDASIAGLWTETEENKIAAGQKYGGKRLRFTGEPIHNFGGNTKHPILGFVAKEERYSTEIVNAIFAEENGPDFANLNKGDKISFVCGEVSEEFLNGYSLDECKLEK